MLQTIENLPANVWGLRAIGKVSRNDYDTAVLPALEELRRQGRTIRLLYHLGPQFEGFTPGGAWEDARVGLKYLRLFERCAVVTDIDWIATAARAAATMAPCPVKVFRNADWDAAVAWATASAETSVTYRLMADLGILIVEPHGRLRAEDFDALTATVDEWLESAGRPLEGIVVHTRRFPGWENLGSLFRHMRFVRDHHRQVRRIAVSTDTSVAVIAAALADHFVAAEIKRYDYDDLECAINWVAGRRTSVETDGTERPRGGDEDSAHLSG